MTRPYFEGKMQQVHVNKFERNPELRERCIQHWGCKCRVRDFDFSATYGRIGSRFIHVHHIVPLAEIRDEHQVDPVNDLIPVCPNCHAMLHRGREIDNPRKIKELKSLVNARKKRRDS